MNTIELAIKELKERDEEIKALKEGRQAMAKELHDRKEKIDKAREYIEKHQCCDGKINVMTLTEYKELLEILDKENKE